ncbi:hypothetical protein QEH56_12370 [Pelagicoccus enzymogenes]|uniref:hypothetical protein n=1 Tax=Pelagicoccus enzymogenes TaxID=2773457 RepID=UPI00280DFD37|nr:hypothetical protein [Pelagicoccus enzymogenes]MDQ8198952.1 hypothetical protein [Pelagicoccus enzymogenes]
MPVVPINTAFKLQAPVPGFTFFAQDQVLTAEQLNQLIQYLDFQERQTRAWLVGTGIVCGLELKVSADRILLSAGCALTTDGDLLALPADKELALARPFKDENAKYPPLASASGLQELISKKEQETSDGSKAITANLLKNKVLVLYLESYTKEPDFCTTENCDNKGKIQHNKLRVLLAPTTAFSPLSAPLSQIASQLPELAPIRPKIQSGIVKKLEGSDSLQSRYTKAIDASASVVAKAFSFIEKQKQAFAPATGGDDLKWLSKLPKGFNPNTEIRGLQSVYSFYRDFCQAFNEWKESLFQNESYCVPPLEAHPKHVLLGLPRDTSPCDTSGMRHGFVRSHANHANANAGRRTQLLWDRLRSLAQNLDYARTFGLPEVRICTSPACSNSLGQRSIPAYYKNLDTIPWRVENLLRCDASPAPSYDNNDENSLEQALPENGFLRIEGHLGKSVDSVTTRLEQLRDQYNLPFQILSIQIEDDPDFVRIPPIRFFDLETAFFDQRSRFKLHLRDLDGFTDRLQTEIDAGQDRVPTGDNSVSKVDLVKTRDAAGQVRAKSKSALTELPSSLQQATSDKGLRFMADYSETVRQGHIVNRNIGSISSNVHFSPVDRIVQPDFSANWKILIDRLKKRKRKIAQLSTFEKFLRKNPGLEHLGGVPIGGTFILVYSKSEDTSKQIVKADFCLPYYSYFDLATLEEEDAPVEPEIKIPEFDLDIRPWKDIYDWKVSPVTEIAVDNIFTAKTANFTQYLDTTITERVTSSFDIFKDIASFTRATTPGKGDLDIDFADPGRFGNKAPEIIEMERELTGLQNEIERIRKQKDLGIAPANADKQIVEIEKKQADAASRTMKLIAEEAELAASQGRSVNTSYVNLGKTATNMVMDMETTEGQKIVAESADQLVASHSNNNQVKKLIGNMGAVAKVRI